MSDTQRIREIVGQQSYVILAPLLLQVKQDQPVPIVGVVSDGQSSIRKVVIEALPEAAHGLCPNHYLREATKGIYEADCNCIKGTEKTSARSARTGTCRQ